MAKKATTQKTQTAYRGVAEEHGSKSTALGPMIWLIGLLAASYTASIYKGGQASTVLAILLSISVAAFIGMYIYFGISKPDLLRSENHIYRMTELGRLGDEKFGFHEPPSIFASSEQGANDPRGIEPPHRPEAVPGLGSDAGGGPAS